MTAPTYEEGVAATVAAHRHELATVGHVPCKSCGHVRSSHGMGHPNGVGGGCYACPDFGGGCPAYTAVAT